MSRIFGCISNQPHRLAEALAPVRAAFVAHPPIARWGLSYVQGGEVLLSLHPRAVEGPLDFFPVVSSLASDCMVGAADADDGLAGATNTQPFRFRRWMFAQENAAPIGGERPLDAIALAIPDFLRRNIRGRSVAEHVFHLFLARLHQAGALDAPDLGPAAIRRALGETAARIAPLGEAAAGNLVVSNSRALVAVRLSGPLFVRRLKQQSDPRRPESQFRSVLVVSADRSPGEGFEELPPRNTLTINRDVSTDIADLEPRDPSP